MLITISAKNSLTALIMLLIGNHRNYTQHITAKLSTLFVLALENESFFTSHEG